MWVFERFTVVEFDFFSWRRLADAGEVLGESTCARRTACWAVVGCQFIINLFLYMYYCSSKCYI